MATIKDRYILEIDTKGADRNIDSTKGRLGGFGAAMARLGPIALAAGAAVGGIAAVQGIKDTAGAMDDLVKSAREVGATASEADFARYQEVREFFNQGGVGAATFERGLRQLNAQMLQAATDGTGALKDAWSELSPILTDASGALLQPAEAVIELQKALSEGKISQEAFNDAMKAVGATAGPAFTAAMSVAAGSAAELEESIQGVSENAATFTLAAGENAETFNDRLQDLSNNFTGLKQDLVSALLPALVSLAEGALAILPPIIDAVRGAFENLQPLFSAVGEIIKAFIPVAEALFSIIGKVFDIIMPLVNIALTGLVEGFRLVASALEFVINGFNTFFSGLSGVADMVGNVTEAIMNGFKNMGEKILGFVTAPLDGIKRAFDNLYQYLWGGSVAKDIVNETIGGFDEMSTSMLDSVNGVATNIRNAFSNIFNSVRSGLSSAVSAASSGFRNAIGGVSNWFNETFGSAGDTAEETRSQLEDALGGGMDISQLQNSSAALGQLGERFATVQPAMMAYTSTAEMLNVLLDQQAISIGVLNENFGVLTDLKSILNSLQETEVTQTGQLVEYIGQLGGLLETENTQLAAKTDNLGLLNEVLGQNEANTRSFFELLGTTFETMRTSVDLDKSKADSSKAFNDALTSSGTFLQNYADALQSLVTWTTGLNDDTNTLATSFNALGSAANAASQEATNAIQQITRQMQLQNQANANNVSFSGSNTNSFNPFAGFFADGGFIPRGKFGVVGEEGPELISGPAQITPMDQIGTGNNTTNVTYNISAVDARSFKQLVAEDPQFIHSVAAYGARSMPKRRV